ncbi:hypothetical protein NIASO_14830 [Niabella soli DSM 19437]|uniref:Uncharacterized protein n=1 Tax=Niabella soli DSM 19437 TaxID=929713 RepID=W0F8X7_9BACT|nr:hypothetical protein NIASO_14830 [Niabella soli DSM 19437]
MENPSFGLLKFYQHPFDGALKQKFNILFCD